MEESGRNTKRLKKKKKTSYFNVIVLSVSTAFLFSSFNSAQGFYTSIHSDGGTILSVVYLSFGIFSLFGTFVVHFFGAKMTLILSTFLYYIFIVSAGTQYDLALYVIAFIAGFGSAVFWVAQALILVRSATKETMGIVSGLFFAIYQLSNITGFLLTGFLENILRLGDYTTFIVLACVCAMGMFLMLCLKHSYPTTIEDFDDEELDADDEETEDENIPSKSESVDRPMSLVKIKNQEKTTIQENDENVVIGPLPGDDSSPTLISVPNDPRNPHCAQFLEMMKTLVLTLYVSFDLKNILLTPIYFYQGYAYAFYYGTLTKNVGSEYIAWCFCSYALAGAIGSILFGNLIGDRWSRKWSMTFVLCIHFLGCILLFFISNPKCFPWIYFVITSVCGLANGGLVAMIYSVMGRYFLRDPAPSFGYFRVVNAFASSIEFVVSDHVDFFSLQLSLWGALVVSFVGFVVLQFVEPIDFYRESEKDHNVLFFFVKKCSCRGRKKKKDGRVGTEEEGLEKNKDKSDYQQV